MASLTNTRLRKALRKVTVPQTGWLDVFPAVIGKADGTVETGTAGEIFVRNVLNGQVLTVHNSVAPNVATLQVEVGRRVEQPNLWQVKGVREAYTTPAGSGLVPYHAEQHVFPQPDTVFANRKQILTNTVLVKDAATFTVQVYGSIVLTRTGFARINNQTVNLSSYIPDAGALYVAIESDDDGVLMVHEGDVFEAPNVNVAADLPAPAVGKYPIAFVLLFEGMTELKNEHILVPFPIQANPTNSELGEQIHGADEVTELEDDDEIGLWEALTGLVAKITWANIVTQLIGIFDALYAALGHTHDATEITGQYRQFVYEVVSGDIVFLQDDDGYPLFNLSDLE